MLKAAKLPEHFTPHCLHHSYASILLSEGVSPVYVQEQLGHATIELTVSTYGRWLKKKAPGALDRLDFVTEVASGSKVVAKQGLEEQRPSLRRSKGRIFKHLRWSRRPGLNGRPVIGSALKPASPIPKEGASRRGQPPHDPFHEGDTSPRILCSLVHVSIGKAPGGFAIWSRRLGMNRRPAVYETAALPTELRRLFGKKRPYPITGFSQASRGISLRGPFEK